MFTSWVFWLWIIIALLVGAVVGFFVAQRQLKKYLQKNPPINEEVVCKWGVHLLKNKLTK